MNVLTEQLGLGALAKQPMPSLNGRKIKEPSELELQRAIRCFKDGRLDEVEKSLQDWMCYRLIPSMIKFGTYPPPYETPAANDE